MICHFVAVYMPVVAACPFQFQQNTFHRWPRFVCAPDVLFSRCALLLWCHSGTIWYNDKQAK